MTYALSKTSSERLHLVDSRLYHIINLALTISKIDFGIPVDGGRRTASRQHELFLSGKSKADGYSKLSNHQSGNAFDVYAYVDGKASWNESHLTHVATAILAAASQLKTPLVWGGHWKSFVDMPHFELKL